MSLTIGFVLDDSLDKTDGVQQYVLTLGRWLSDAGHEVHYLVGETKRTDIPNVHSLSANVSVRFNGNRMSMPTKVNRKALTQLYNAVRFDVLHVQMPYSPLLAGKIIGLAPPETLVFGTFHIAPYSSGVTFANKLLGLALSRSLRRFNKVVSVSSAARDFASLCYGLRETAVLPNVINTAPYQNIHQTSPDTPTIVFLGRLVPRKGCKLLLEAAIYLRDSLNITNFQIKIGGTGPLMQELQDFVAAHHMEKQVTFLGFVEEKDKPGFLADATVAVFPSTGGESFGIVLLEAMAAKGPVVMGGDNAGYRTVLGDKPELLFEPDNSQQLAKKLRQLISDEGLRTDLVRWQTNHLRQYEVSSVGTQLVGYYEQALRDIQKMR